MQWSWEILKSSFIRVVKNLKMIRVLIIVNTVLYWICTKNAWISNFTAHQVESQINCCHQHTYFRTIMFTASSSIFQASFHKKNLEWKSKVTCHKWWCYLWCYYIVTSFVTFVGLTPSVASFHEWKSMHIRYQRLEHIIQRLEDIIS